MVYLSRNKQQNNRKMMIHKVTYTDTQYNEIREDYFTSDKKAQKFIENREEYNRLENTDRFTQIHKQEIFVK